MATAAPKAKTTQELTVAVNTLLEREENRVEQERRSRRRRIQRRRKQTDAAIERLGQSIEVIKWCIVGITTVMAISLVILIAVIWEIGNEAERIKVEVEEIKGEAEAIVQQIQHEADLIRDKIRHPLETLGGTLGGSLGRQLESAVLGGDADD